MSSTRPYKLDRVAIRMVKEPLLDHIIIGNGDQYYSFKENSVIPIGTQMFARDAVLYKGLLFVVYEVSAE